MEAHLGPGTGCLGGLCLGGCGQSVAVWAGRVPGPSHCRLEPGREGEQTDGAAGLGA